MQDDKGKCMLKLWPDLEMFSDPPFRQVYWKNTY